MERYLIDTNAVSDYLSASLPVKGIAFMDTAIDAVPNISIITQIELLCWKTDLLTERNVQSFNNDSTILDITQDVISRCVLIRRSKKIKLPDAIIAATSLVYNLILISRNTSDFKNIDGLQVIDPYSL